MCYTATRETNYYWQTRVHLKLPLHRQHNPNSIASATTKEKVRTGSKSKEPMDIQLNGQSSVNSIPAIKLSINDLSYIS